VTCMLLAPALCQLDQFQNYEHRGRGFKELVQQWSGTRRVQPRGEGERSCRRRLENDRGLLSDAGRCCLFGCGRDLSASAVPGGNQQYGQIYIFRPRHQARMAFIGLLGMFVFEKHGLSAVCANLRSSSVVCSRRALLVGTFCLEKSMQHRWINCRPGGSASENGENPKRS